MFPNRYRRLLLVLIGAALVLGACSDDTSDTTVAAEGDTSDTTMAAEGDTSDTTMAEDMEMEDDDHGDFAFGEPADAADADRTIEIVAGDELRFSPDAVTVTAGETITFHVTNEGNLPHDFTLGDEAAQAEHEEEMAEMEGEMVHDDANTLFLASGETKELTWHFTEPGTVLYGCHEPGHYDAGMVGEITVSS